MAFQFTQTGQELQYLFNEVEQLAGDYDGTQTYVVGDYCNYLGVVYKCTASTTGTFDAADWASVVVMDELEALTATVANIGTVIQSNSGSEASGSLAVNTNANICTISLPAGTWVITGDITYASAAEGVRVIDISTTSATIEANGGRAQVYTGGTGSCAFSTTRIMTLASTTTIYLVGYSGVACNYSAGYLRAIRIA